jgi:MFS family permease
MRERSANWVLAAVFATSLGVGLIFGFEPPLIAIVLNRAGHGSVVIGAVIAISLVAVILIGPWYPLAIARLGLYRSVVIGVLIGVLVLLLMPVWIAVPAWMALRIVTGCALGLGWIASEIWMNVATGAASRGAVMGIYGTVFSTGTVAGPLLLELTGTRGPLPFVIGAACLALTLLPLVLLPQAARHSAAQQSDLSARTAAQPLGALFRYLPAAPIVMMAAAVAGLVESADLSLLPLYGLHAGLDEHTALLLVTVFLAGNVVLQFPIGLLADRVGRRRVLGLCALASTIGPLLLPFALDRGALLWPLLFVWGGTLYAFYSQGVALLGEAFAPETLAGANTLFVMIYCVGGVIGPSAGGLAMALWPQRGLPALLCAAALSLVVALGLGAVRRPRGPSPA